MLTSTESIWFKTGIELTEQLADADIEVLRLAAFEPDNFKAPTLSQIKHSDIRIVVLLAYGNDTQEVASSADQQGMSRSYAWILMEMLTQATEQMQGWLYVQPFLPSEGMQAFAKQVSDYTKSHFDIAASPDLVDLAYSVALHDAILLYAHAATKVLSEGGDLQNGTAVTEAVRSVSFMGIGSQVALTKQGDRNESYEVMNIMVRADRGSGGYEAQTFVVHVHAGSNRGSNLFLEVLCAQVRAFLRVCVHACLHACMPV